MKKCGDLYTAKGKGSTGTVERLTLFDGRFDTAYRLISIEIAGTDPKEQEELLVKVMTEDAASSQLWDWSSNTEIAWASINTPVNSRWGYNSFIDPDNLIVEDVFIDFAAAGGSGSADINYMLTFQKYDITEWKGALAMVRNKSQG